MKTNKMKMIAIFTVLAMALFSAAVIFDCSDDAEAAPQNVEIKVSTSEEFAEALDKAQEGDTIILTSNIDVAIGEKPFMTKHNNVTIIGTKDGVKEGGFVLNFIHPNLILADGTVFKDVTINACEADTLFRVVKYVDVTFDNCVFDADGDVKNVNFIKAIDYYGELTVTGCVFIDENRDDNYDVRVEFLNDASEKESKVTVTYCEFRFKINPDDHSPVELQGERITSAMYLMSGNHSDVLQIPFATDGNVNLRPAPEGKEAMLNGKSYDKAQDALSDVGDEGTVYILKDCTYKADTPSTMIKSKDVTVIGNRCTITMDSTLVTVASGTTFYDVTFKAIGTGDSDLFVTNEDPNDLSFFNCRFTGGSDLSRYVYAGDYVGKMTFSGCHFETDGYMGHYITVKINQFADIKTTNVVIKGCTFSEIPSKIEGQVPESVFVNKNGGVYMPLFGYYDISGNTDVKGKPMVMVYPGTYESEAWGIRLMKQSEGWEAKTIMDGSDNELYFKDYRVALELAESGQTVVTLVTLVINKELLVKDKITLSVGHGTTMTIANEGMIVGTGALEAEGLLLVQGDIADEITLEADLRWVYKDEISYSSLSTFRDYANAGKHFEDYKIELLRDVNLSGAWTPIAQGGYREKTTDVYFSGTFNGMKYRINGLTNIGYTPAKTDASGRYAYGLFGVTKNACIFDLTLGDVYIDTGVYGDSVGALIGFSAGNLTVSNVLVYGVVKGIDAVGGVVGRAYNTLNGSNLSIVSIENCVNNADVTAYARESGGTKVAGILGYTSSYSSLKIVDNINSGKITNLGSTENKGYYAAGIVCLGGSSSYVEDTYCVEIVRNNNTATVSAYTYLSTTTGNVAQVSVNASYDYFGSVKCEKNEGNGTATGNYDYFTGFTYPVCNFYSSVVRNDTTVGYSFQVFVEANKPNSVILDPTTHVARVLYGYNSDGSVNSTGAVMDKITAAGEGDTVTLTGHTSGICVQIDRPLTLDLGGYKMTTGEDITLKITSSDVTVKNGALASGYRCIGMFDNSSVTIEGVAMSLDDGEYTICMHCNNSTVTVDNSTELIESLFYSSSTTNTFVINGGRFTADPSANIGEEKAVSKDADGKFTVFEDSEVVAKIGAYGYKTLSSALGVAVSGQTVSLVADDAISADASVGIGVALVVGNGVTLTVDSGVTLTVEGAMTNNGAVLNNGSIDVKGTLTSDVSRFAGSSGTVVFEGGSTYAAASGQIFGSSSVSIGSNATVTMSLVSSRLNVSVDGTDGLSAIANVTVPAGTDVVIDGQSKLVLGTKTLTIKDDAKISGKIVTDGTNYVIVSNLNATGGDVTISKGSVVISGTIDASDNVTIGANGEVKLNGVTVTGSTGSLVITEVEDGDSNVTISNLTVSGGATVKIQTDVTLAGTSNNMGTIEVSADSNMTVPSGAVLNVKGSADLDNKGQVTIATGGVVNLDGRINNEPSAYIYNYGTIAGTGEINNAGSIIGNTPAAKVYVDQIRFNLLQYVTNTNPSESGVSVTVMPDYSLDGKFVKEAVEAYVTCIVADNSVARLGTIVTQKEIVVDDSAISYNDGKALFKVDLKNNSITSALFANIVLVWAAYTFESSDGTQMTGISDVLKFNPSKEYISKD